MKKLIAILAAALMLAALTGCGAKAFNKDQLTLSEYNDTEMNTLVQLFVKQKTVTDATEEAALSIINLGDTDYSYDAVQRLEVKLDSQWYVVPDKQDGVIMAIYFLTAKGSSDGDMFYFSGHYDKLPQGSYRIVKAFTGVDGSMAYGAAEFDIR